MLNTTDVAYIVALIEKSPSVYPRRQNIINDLQAAWKASSARGGEPWNMPVAVGVVQISATERK